MNKKQKALMAILLAVLAGAIVWAVSTVPAPPAPQPEQAPNKIMKYTGGNTLSEEKDGRKVWELTAETMDVNVETQDAECTNIVAKFYQESGDAVELKAPHGSYEAASRNLKLDGGIQAQTPKNASLVSDTLVWDAAASTLTAAGNARITHEDMEATGDELQSSDGFEVFKAKGNAHIVKGKAE